VFASGLFLQKFLTNRSLMLSFLVLVKAVNLTWILSWLGFLPGYPVLVLEEDEFCLCILVLAEAGILGYMNLFWQRMGFLS
jgi:hypothetical protein